MVYIFLNLRSSSRSLQVWGFWEYLSTLPNRESSAVAPGFSWSHSPSLGVIAPSSPTIIELLWPLFSTSSQVPPSAPILLQLIILLPNVAVTYHCYIYHHCCFLLLVCYHSVWLIGQFLPICLVLEILQDPNPVIHHDLLWHFPSGLGRVFPIPMQMFLYTSCTLSVFLYTMEHNYLLVLFSVYCSCLYLISATMTWHSLSLFCIVCTLGPL